MSITFGDRLIDIGYYDITPEKERELEAREECERRGIDPDVECADGGVLAWMVVDQQMRGCPVCGGDCAGANLPVMSCPMQEAEVQLSQRKTR